MNQRRSLTDQALFLMGGRLTAFALTFALPFVLVRIFSKYEFGLYRQFSVFFLILWLVAQFGLSYSLPSLIPRFPDQTKSILANTILVQGSVCLLLILGGSVITFAGEGWGIPKDFVKFALPLGIFSGFMVASSPFDPVLIVEDKGREAGLLIALFDMARSLFILLTAFFLRDIVLVMWAVGCAAFLRFLAMVLYIQRQYALRVSHLSFKTFVEQVRLAGPMTVQSCAFLIESQVDKYLVIYMYSTATYAIYTVGAFQIPLVAMLFHSIANVILPRLAEYYGQGKLDELLELWNEAIRKSTVLLFPFFALMFTVHYEFILFLFTDKYAQSIPIFAVYLWIIPTYIMGNNLLLQAIGHGRYLFLSGLIKPLIAFILVTYGLNYGGLVGAATGSVIHSYLSTVLYMLYSAYALKVSFRSLIPLRVLAQVSLLMAVAYAVTYAFTTFGLGQIPNLPIFALLCIKSLFFCIVAFLLMYNSSVVTPGDRAQAKTILVRVLTKLGILKPQTP